MGNQDIIRQNFGPRAANYRTSSVHGNPADLERMTRLLHLSEEARVLDVATGGGHTAVQLAPWVKQVVATDITVEMLAQAQELARQNRRENIEFRLEDVHSMNLADNSFDAVVSRFAIHHFADVNRALQEMCRVLKPGGKLYILDCSVADGEESEELYNKIELLRDSSHVCSYSPRQWKAILSSLPLQMMQMDFLTARYELPDWFDRMDTPEAKRREIFALLEQSSSKFKELYPYDESWLTAYRIEILAKRF